MNNIDKTSVFVLSEEGYRQIRTSSIAQTITAVYITILSVVSQLCVAVSPVSVLDARSSRLIDMVTFGCLLAIYGSITTQVQFKNLCIEKRIEMDHKEEL